MLLRATRSLGEGQESNKAKSGGSGLRRCCFRPLRQRLPLTKTKQQQQQQEVAREQLRRRRLFSQRRGSRRCSATRSRPRRCGGREPGRLRTTLRLPLLLPRTPATRLLLLLPLELPKTTTARRRKTLTLKTATEPKRGAGGNSGGATPSSAAAAAAGVATTTAPPPLLCRASSRCSPSRPCPTARPRASTGCSAGCFPR